MTQGWLMNRLVLLLMLGWTGAMLLMLGWTSAMLLMLGWLMNRLGLLLMLGWTGALLESMNRLASNSLLWLRLTWVMNWPG